MQIFIKLYGDKTFTLMVDPACTILKLKTIIENRFGYPLVIHTRAHPCSINFAGRQLENDRTLSDYNIQKESTLHIILNFGGPHTLNTSIEIVNNFRLNYNSLNKLYIQSFSACRITSLCEICNKKTKIKHTIRTNCHHYFCKSCLNNHITTDNKCPVNDCNAIISHIEVNISNNKLVPYPYD